MGYQQSWEWEAPIADASRFAAWSHDVEQLQIYLAVPGRLLPSEIPGLNEILTQEQMSIYQATSVIPADVKKPPEFKVASPLIICGPYGTGKPLFTPTEVAFNGDCSTSDCCETFRITLQDLEAPLYDRCKTLKCSYDLLVLCALVRLAHHFPTICIYSDGGKGAVERAVKICQQIFANTAFPRLCFGDDED